MSVLTISKLIEELEEWKKDIGDAHILVSLEGQICPVKESELEPTADCEYLIIGPDHRN